MALMYYPPAGEILLCNYSTGFIKPEMDKLRPVVVVSPRLRRRNELVAVVPLSTTAPASVENYHYKLTLAHPLPRPYDSLEMWAKCDMLATVARARLDRFKAGRSGGGGARKYVSGKVNAEQLQAIKSAMLCGLGLDSLTIHL